MYAFSSCFMRIAYAISFGLLSGLGEATVAPEGQVVTVYFIRHAQSMWNVRKAMRDWKNADPEKTGPPEWAKDGQNKEIWDLEQKLGGKFGNSYKDVPLTTRGIEQVKELRDWWQAQSTCAEGTECGKCVENAVQCMNENIWPGQKYTADHSDKSATQTCSSLDPKSFLDLKFFERVVFGVSNLKRAIETMLVFMSGLGLTNERKPVLHIVSKLQETSGGKDAQTTLKYETAPFKIDDNSESVEKINYSNALKPFGNTPLPFTFDVSANVGGQLLGGKGGEVAKKLVGGHRAFGRRLRDFCTWLGLKTDKDHKTFVLSGHSSFLMDFFGAFLQDEDINLAEKILLGGKGTGLKLKLGNASMIKFELNIAKTPWRFRKGFNIDCSILPKSTQLLYGEWQVQGEVKDNTETVSLRDFVGKSSEYREGRKDLRGTCPKPSGGDE
jgi:broad specificity phosphatase PhoE